MSVKSNYKLFVYSFIIILLYFTLFQRHRNNLQKIIVHCLFTAAAPNRQHFAKYKFTFIHSFFIVRSHSLSQPLPWIMTMMVMLWMDFILDIYYCHSHKSRLFIIFFCEQKKIYNKCMTHPSAICFSFIIFFLFCNILNPVLYFLVLYYVFFLFIVELTFLT